MNDPVISVIVCVYNGEQMLPRCLRSLAVQTAGRETFEVIVINNNSTDGTQQVAGAFIDSPPNIRLFNEEEIGLSSARNRGYKEARGRYVAYLDDDARATPTWIEEALKIIEARKPVVFGGPIYPWYDEPREPWVKDEYNSYSVYEASGCLEAGRYLSGSNIFLQREVLAASGGFDANLGMRADQAGYHEETALQLRLRADNHSIYYDPRLQVLHLVPAAKQNILYYLYSNYKSGKDGKYLRDMPQDYEGLLDLLKQIEGFFLGVETAMKSRDPAAHPYPENYVIEELMPRLVEIGSRIEQCCQQPPVEFEEYLRYVVKNKQVPLSECLRIFQALNPKALGMPALISAYEELDPRKTRSMKLGPLIEFYRRHARMGLWDSMKYAGCVVYYSSPLWLVGRWLLRRRGRRTPASGRLSRVS